MKKDNHALLQDLGIIALSIFVGIILAQSDAFVEFLASTTGLGVFGSFLAGLFFPFIFTAIPATVIIIEIGLYQPIWQVAVFGAMGAVLADIVIFQFIRDRFSENLIAYFKKKQLIHKYRLGKGHPIYRTLTIIFGAFLIASPGPDELGIALLGFTKLRLRHFILLSYALNFCGLLALLAITNVILT